MKTFIRSGIIFLLFSLATPTFAQSADLWDQMSLDQKYVIVLSLSQGYNVAASLMDFSSDSGESSKKLVHGNDVFKNYDGTRRDQFISYGIDFFDRSYRDPKNASLTFADIYLKLLISWAKR